MRDVTLTIEGKKQTLGYNQHFANLIAINQSLTNAVHESFQRRKRIYVDVPEMVGITGACENVDTLFKLGNRLDIPLFFTQTGQLALEQSLQCAHAVYTVIHSGRDEEEEDKRHVRQFRLTEEEFDCTTIKMNRNNYDEDRMYEALLQSIQTTVQDVIKKILDENEEILRAHYTINIKRLKIASTTPFLRITYEDAIALLHKHGYPQIVFGDDMLSEHEATIVEVLNKKDEKLPVFIMKYPKEIKFFNMKTWTKDERLALSADLIFPFAGEGTGSAVREHDYEKLNERLLTSNMYKLHVKRGGKYEDFEWYLNIMKQKGTMPHAGYGMGNDRVMQYIFGETDIRNVSIFSQLNKQTGDWDKKRYGQAPIVSHQKKKHILLSIGRMSDKKYLLSSIKKLAKQTNYIFYATQKTHSFLRKNSVTTSHVYKISDVGQTPNISDLMTRRIFDLIINTPSRDKVNEGNEFTDGKLISKGAVNLGIKLITDPEVAAMILSNLSKTNGDIPTA